MTQQEFLRHSSLVLGGALLVQACGRIGQSQAMPVFDLHTHPGPFFYKGTANYPGDQQLPRVLYLERGAGLERLL